MCKSASRRIESDFRTARRSLTAAALGLGILWAVPSVQAQCEVSDPVRLMASDASAQDYFGISVSISGDTAVVGAWNDDHSGRFDAGSAYVYVRNGENWTQQAKLIASDPGDADYFGYSVSVSGDTAVIGAWKDGFFNLPGAAYVFVRSAGVWTQQAKLLPSDGAADDQFGYSVALDGDTAVIGSPSDNHAAGADAGSAYVFTRAGASWTQRTKMIAPDAAANDGFGRRVALDGDTVLVGSWLDDHAGGDAAGSAYIYVGTNGMWSFEAKLTASDAAAGDNFGASVGISGDTAVIGASRDDHVSGSDAGSAYVFVRSAGVWSQQAKLVSSDSVADDRFGDAVSVAGDVAVIGAPFDDHGAGTNAGTAYIYLRSGSTWLKRARFRGTDPQRVSQFAAAVAVADGTAVIGMHRAGGSFTGAAFVFDDLRPDCNANGLSDDCDLAAGTAADCNGNAVPDSCDIAVGTSDDCTLNAVPDECDLAAGTADDINTNSIPDTCEPACSRLEVVVLQGSAASDNDGFGYSAALAGNTAIIGASGDDDAGIDAGAAYVFERFGGTWNEIGKIFASDAAPGSWFGTAIASDGDTVVIGALRADHAEITDAGAVYVFVNSNGVWTEQAKLTASDPEESSDFGRIVAIAGDRAIISAPFSSHSSLNSPGAVYIFERADGIWSEHIKLIASDAGSVDFFGAAIAMSGDTIVVGAPWDDHAGGSDAGSAYVFVWDGEAWSEQAKLTAADPQDDQSFGSAVAIMGDTIMVGAETDDSAFGSSAGAIYVFGRAGSVWSQEAKLFAVDAAPHMAFGSSIVWAGDVVLVGTLDGAAYAFLHGPKSWTSPARLIASGNLHALRTPGAPLAVSGDIAVLSTFTLGKVFLPGAALIYSHLADCDGNAILDTCEALGDGNLGNEDEILLANCLLGPEEPSDGPCCGYMDMDGNGRVDLVDFGLLQRLASP